MSQELTTKEEATPVAFNSDLVNQSKKLAGQTSGNFIPFIPILEINNKDEKKMAMVDGKEQEVEVSAVQGFNILTRNEETREYQRNLLEGNIKAVILKERYMIEKKYNPESKDVQYKSDEFDNWDEIIKLHNRMNRKEIIMEGTYSEIRDTFTSEIKDKEGKLRKVKDYALYAILYINLDNKNEIYRLKIKMTTDNRWFDYKNEFGENEPWAGFITHFNLAQKTFGKVTYWFVEFKRGDMVDLEHQLELQKEINKFFIIADTVRQTPLAAQGEVITEEKKDEVDISQIPF